MMPRFRLEGDPAHIRKLLAVGMRMEVEARGGFFVADEETRRHIAAAASWLMGVRTGLFLGGLCGNGKTTLARAVKHVVEAVSDRELGSGHGIVPRFLTAKQICRLCVKADRVKEAEAAWTSLGTAPVLIIDDLGEEPREVLVFGQPVTPLIDLLSERYDRRLMTVVTSNLTGDEIEKKYGARIRDRFREMMQTVSFTNDSYRRPEEDRES